jgi:hypothetical protein
MAKTEYGEEDGRPFRPIRSVTTSSLLILVGYPPLEALVYVLIFNTAPVAFGALGAAEQQSVHREEFDCLPVSAALGGLHRLDVTIKRNQPWTIPMPFTTTFVAGANNNLETGDMC